MIYGYARVSTDAQDLSSQLAALLADWSSSLPCHRPSR